MTHLQAGLLLLAIALVIWALMWFGWRGRVRRQRDVPALPAVPQGVVERGDAVRGTYVSTTRAGDWLDRIVAHGLGVRSEVTVTVREETPAGVLLARGGAPDVWIAAADITGVRRERGMAGKYVEREGLVVLSWRHGDLQFDTGIRPTRAADAEVLTTALQRFQQVRGEVEQ